MGRGVGENVDYGVPVYGVGGVGVDDYVGGKEGRGEGR